YHAGIAVRRLHVTCQAPGGHSWLHYGRPSAVHALIDASARIITLNPPTDPRTTFNIGLINGGHSINSIAMNADLYLDMRSESVATLADFEQEVRAAIQAVERPHVDLAIEVVGDRPSGHIPVKHPLVQLATAALQAIDHQPEYETGSTDANIMLAHGLPTVTIGITYGGNAHRLDEYIETKPISFGIWQLVLLTLAAADYLHTG
ncbi:MAG: M20/M25/M40 family metallo-hydrolase, partial [Anaerolineae bacterium]|nr:M20/M25/M40 family metallo-hydrolase [Anaerolineae bacterium]